MKQSLAIVLSVLMSGIVHAQNNAYPVNPYPRTISVNGSAEMEVVPDEIYVQIELREYDKKGSGKVNLESIQQKFFAATRGAGIPDSLISIVSYQGYDRAWQERRRKKNPDLMASVSYQVKFTSPKKIDELVAKLDDEATQNFYITRMSHSKLEEFRKQLKIQALVAAKDKANYLSAALGQQVGDVITIEEPTEYAQYPMYRNAMANKMVAAEAADQSEPNVDFRKIKLRFEVRSVFAIK